MGVGGTEEDLGFHFRMRRNRMQLSPPLDGCRRDVQVMPISLFARTLGTIYVYMFSCGSFYDANHGGDFISSVSHQPGSGMGTLGSLDGSGKVTPLSPSASIRGMVVCANGCGMIKA